MKGGDTYFIKLRPVNYSVATNEDVFEYIKRDILIQLDKENRLANIDIESALESICDWKNIKSLINLALSLSPKGALCSKILDFVEETVFKYRDKYNTFSKYESVFESQRGGLYENDAYTELINTTLRFIEHPATRKHPKTCLIIEDLDRMDPAHLFRILNVIGAHIDADGNEEHRNKFGFDYIILVMDYDVTKEIFHHFYGERSNYEGYMAKFFTSYPWRYSLQYLAIEKLKKILTEKYNIDETLLKTPYFNHYYRDAIEDAQSKGKITPGKTLNQRFLELSIRDIARIIDGLDSSISNISYKTETGIQVDAKTPIAIFLLTLKFVEAEYNILDLKDNLNKLGKEYTEALGSFLYDRVDENVVYHHPGQEDRVSISFKRNGSGNILPYLTIMDTTDEDNVQDISKPRDEAFLFATQLIDGFAQNGYMLVNGAGKYPDR